MLCAGMRTFLPQRAVRNLPFGVPLLIFHIPQQNPRSFPAAGFSVSKKWQMPLFRGSKFGQPEVARICKELILQAKSTTQQGAVFPQGKTAVAKRLGFSFEKPTVRRQSRLTRSKVRGAAAPPTPSEVFLTVCKMSPVVLDFVNEAGKGLFFFIHSALFSKRRVNENVCNNLRE